MGSAERKRYSEIIDAFQGARVLVAGDIILDHYVWGKVDRISPEAPVVVVQVNKEEFRLGGSANVVRNICSLGAEASLCGVIGEDDAGRTALFLLEELNVERAGVIRDGRRMTTRKTRVIAHQQQVVRIDREIIHPLEEKAAEALASEIAARFKGSRAVIISDYGKGSVCPQIFQKVDEGYQSGLLGAKKIPVLVDPKSPHFDLYTRATIIKPNRKEAEEASGRPIPDRQAGVEVAKHLRAHWGSEMVLLTLGDEGMVLVSDVSGEEPVFEVDTEAREVFDVSGAGDTVSAVFALALGVGASPREAAVLANISAGIVVGEVGTVAIKAERLRSALQKI